MEKRELGIPKNLAGEGGGGGGGGNERSYTSRNKYMNTELSLVLRLHKLRKGGRFECHR